MFKQISTSALFLGLAALVLTLAGCATPTNGNARMPSDDSLSSAKTSLCYLDATQNVTYDQHLRNVPDLVNYVPASDDGGTYTFRVNNEPVTYKCNAGLMGGREDCECSKQ